MDNRLLLKVVNKTSIHFSPLAYIKLVSPSLMETLRIFYLTQTRWQNELAPIKGLCAIRMT